MGQYDSARPGNEVEVSGNDLVKQSNQLLKTEKSILIPILPPAVISSGNLVTNLHTSDSLVPKLYLIRHGETVSNASGTFQGQTNSPV